jgi:hypothetical protein
MTCAWSRAPLFVLTALGAACSSASSGGPASATTTSLASGLSAQLLALDATNVYAATQSGIVRVPLAGGKPVSLAQLPQQSGASGLAAGGSRVFWSQNDDSGTTPQGTLYSAPIGGGAATTVATVAGYAGAIGTDDTDVYWAGSAIGTACATASCGILVKAPLAGGTAVTLSTSAHSPTSFAFDDTNVYWGSSDGFLLKMPKSGGSPTVLADFESTSIEGVGLAGSTLYWGASGGDVYETPVGGGTSKPLEVSTATMNGAAFTADGVAWGTQSYYADSQTGSVALTSLAGDTSTLWSSGSEAPAAVVARGTTIVFVTSTGSLVEIAW